MATHAPRNDPREKPEPPAWILAFVIIVLAVSCSLLAIVCRKQDVADYALGTLILVTLAFAVSLTISMFRRDSLRNERARIRATLLTAAEEHNVTLSGTESAADLAANLSVNWFAGDAKLRGERDGFKSILAAMSEGILVVDPRRLVLFSNPAARKILNLSDDGGAPRLLSQLTQQAELISNVDTAIDANQACSFEFQLGNGNSGARLNIQAHCAPYGNEKQALSGAVAVLHDITDLRRLERMRSEFVSNVSHELRTPLTSLIGYIETLELTGFEEPEQAREFLRICHRQAENLNRIVEDLLRLSRLEHPQSEIADAHVSLKDVVHSAVEQCALLASKRGIALLCEVPETDARITGDRGLLVQAIGNLIENAIHYNREHGTVTVKLAPVKKAAATAAANGDGEEEFEWQLSVTDTGIGIPADALQRVFERFYRVDKARSRSEGGTGLGLAIVKHIALAHGASVHVESEVNKGSTFLIRLKTRNTRSERLTMKK